MSDITNAQTRLFLDRELLPSVAVDLIKWEDRRSAQACISGPLSALDDLEKIIAKADLDMLVFPQGCNVRNRDNGRVVASFKRLWNVCRWIDNPIVNCPSGEARVTINVSFMCSLEFSDGGNDDQASS